MPNAPLQPIATLGIDIGKNSFHLIGLDARGAIVLRQKLSRGQVEARLTTMPSCLIGIGGLCWRPSSQPSIAGPRPRREADPRPVRDPLPQKPQERLS
jgi:hypothetical protein